LTDPQDLEKLSKIMPFTHTEGVIKTRIFIIQTIDTSLSNFTSFINHITVRSEIYDGYYRDRILVLDYTISPDNETFTHDTNSSSFGGINVSS
jgi:RNA binding exosome subunit